MRYFILSIFTLIFVQPRLSAQVDNDDCANATLLQPGVVLTGQVWQATTEFGANAADGVDENTLATGMGCFKPARTVWYKFRTNQDGGDATVIVTDLGCLGGPDKDQDVIGAIFEVDPNNPCDHTSYQAVTDLGGGIQSCRGFQQGSNFDDFAIGATGLAPSTEYYVMLAADRVITGFTEVTPAECDFKITVEGDVTGAPECFANISSNATVVGNCDATGSSGTVSFTPKGSGNYRLLWEQVEQPAGVLSMSGLPNGVYDAIIFNSEDTDCQVDTNIVIGNINAVTASFNETQATCNTADGELTVAPTGGLSPFTFLWDAFGQTTQTATGLTSGLYVVTVGYGNGCEAVFSDQVSETNQLSSTTSAIAASCQGLSDGTATVVISGGVSDPNYRYNWSTGSSNSVATGLAFGNYTVTATDDANGCFIVTAVTVTEPTAVSVTGTITEIECNGDATGAINVTGSGGNTTSYSYQWSNNSNSQNQTFVAAGDYTITVTDLSSGQCTGQATFSIEDPAPIEITFTSVDPSCEAAENGEITAVVAGGTGGPYATEWLGLTESSLVLSNVGQGTYALRATDLNNCEQTTTITLTPNVSEVVANYSLIQSNVVIPSVVEFTNASEQATVYLWDFGDGGVSFDEDPQYTFDQPGEYTVELIASLDLTMICTDTISQLIQVLDTSSISGTPNVFTPDGDGVNDDFTPGSTGMSDFEVKIFNRYGEMVDHWYGPEGAWYGYTFAGKICPEGTYYYVVEGQGFDGVTHESQVGYVTLLRGD